VRWITRAPGARARPAGSPRAIADYLIALRPILADAVESRRVFVRQLGLLIEEARHGGRALVAQSAGRIGREQGPVFQQLRIRVERLPAPPGCEACHHAVGLWLEKQSEACRVMARTGLNGDPGKLREAQQLLGEACAHAHRFNDEYARLAADLRRRVQLALRERARRRSFRDLLRRTPQAAE
jgi:hypothetical protein